MTDTNYIPGVYVCALAILQFYLFDSIFTSIRHCLTDAKTIVNPIEIAVTKRIRGQRPNESQKAVIIDMM